MHETIEAVYENGAFWPVMPVPGIENHSRVTLNIQRAKPNVESNESRKSLIEKMFGSIKDSTFVRPEQGNFERRDPLE